MSGNELKQRKWELSGSGNLRRASPNGHSCFASHDKSGYMRCLPHVQTRNPKVITSRRALAPSFFKWKLFSCNLVPAFLDFAETCRQRKGKWTTGWVLMWCVFYQMETEAGTIFPGRGTWNQDAERAHRVLCQDAHRQPSAGGAWWCASGWL